MEQLPEEEIKAITKKELETLSRQMQSTFKYLSEIGGKREILDRLDTLMFIVSRIYKDIYIRS